MVLPCAHVGRALQEYDFEDIALRLRQSGYSLAELQAILDAEIAPVFHANLGLFALPEMMGWETEDVKNLVIEYMRKRASIAETLLPRKWLNSWRMAQIQGRWETVKSLLGRIA